MMMMILGSRGGLGISDQAVSCSSHVSVQTFLLCVRDHRLSGRSQKSRKNWNCCRVWFSFRFWILFRLGFLSPFLAQTSVIKPGSAGGFGGLGEATPWFVSGLGCWPPLRRQQFYSAALLQSQWCCSLDFMRVHLSDPCEDGQNHIIPDAESGLCNPERQFAKQLPCLGEVGRKHPEALQKSLQDSGNNIYPLFLCADAFGAGCLLLLLWIVA